MPAFPLGNTGRRSARHPDRLAHVRIYLRRLPSCAGPRFSWPPVTHGTASVSQLLAGGPYWPPGGAPAPPGCVLCEARARAPHPTPPRMTPHESAPRWTGRIGLYSTIGLKSRVRRLLEARTFLVEGPVRDEKLHSHSVVACAEP